MLDLWVAVGILLILSTILFYVGSRFGSSNALPIISTGFILVFATMLHGNLILVKILPVSNVIILGNWLPLGAALLAGILYSRPTTPRWRKTMLAFAILAAGWLTVIWFAFPERFSSLNRYRNGICLQSHPATCSACAAVTLLGYYGIESDEQEMAALCLTSGRGTHLLGIYRGLKLKTRGTAYEVRVVRCDYAELAQTGMTPMLIPVNMATAGQSPETSLANFRSRLLRVLGRTHHCVVLFGFNDAGKPLIGDPANFLYGPAEWTDDELRQYWLGSGFQIVPSPQERNHE